MSFWRDEVRGDLRAALAFVGDLLARGLRAASASTTAPSNPRWRTPTSSASTPISASVRVVTSFFLAAMMPLKDGKRGSLIFSLTLTMAGRRRLQGEHAVVGLALTGDLAVVDRQLAQVGQLRQAQVLGDDGRDRAADTVGGLVAGDDQVDALDGAQRAGQRPAGLDHVGAVQAVVLEVDGLVGAHRQRLADRLGGALGAGGQDGDRALVAVRSFSLISSASSTARSLISSSTASAASRSSVKSPSVQLALRPRVRDLFDQDHDVRHDSGSSSSTGLRQPGGCRGLRWPQFVPPGNVTSR